PSGMCTPTDIFCSSEDAPNPETAFNCTIDVLSDPLDVFTFKADRPKTGISAADDTSATIKALLDAQKGFPARVSGQFVRMLYLSATTITTLGFGDIVPITT